MYLTSIELQGFKSFADKTVLNFLPPKSGKNSVTAIVGPNGSGKSNIADAIRWVLGEQSMKQIRGKKSADVIFLGSESKGQMSVASVTLTFDNRDGRVPIEYEELVIGRKLYRSGESEYLLNGNTVRLLDIQLLLAKAQFGNGSYAVIGQGMIDRTLLLSTEERKAFFDEAAGIKEFQIKRHQAWLKLSRSREHMTQADLLLKEISPRLKTLSRQMKKLEERQTIELELRERQEMYYTALFRDYESRLEKDREALARFSLAYTKKEAELTRIQEELAGLAKASSRQETFQALETAYQDAQRQKNTLERDRAILSGKLETEYAKVGKQNVRWLEDKIAEMAGEVASLQGAVEDLDRKLEEERLAVAALAARADREHVAWSELKQEMVRLERRLAERKNEESIFQITGLRAVQEILRDRNRFSGTIYGALAQLGEADETVYLALDVAAGAHLSSLVVADDATAENCIRFLRENQFGVATFLPHNKIRGRFLPQELLALRTMPGVLGFATDLVRFDDRFAEIFSFVFGSTLVVDTIDTARKIGIGRVRMVTLDGDVLDRGGIMRGGWRKTRGTGLSFAHGVAALTTDTKSDLEERLATLQKELVEKDSATSLSERELQEKKSQILIGEEKRQLLLQRLGQITAERVGLVQELSIHSMSPEEYSRAMAETMRERDTLDKKIGVAEKLVEEKQKAIAAFNNEEEEKKKRVFVLQDEMQRVQAELNLHSQDKSTVQVEIAKRETKLEDLAEEVYEELRVAVSSIASRVKETIPKEKLEQWHEEIEKLKYALSLIGGIDESVATEYEETKVRHDDLSRELSDVTKAAVDLETLIIDLDELMKKKRNKAFKEIRKEFAVYFSLLFGGGKADLVEVYADEESEEEQTGDTDREDGEEARKKKGQILKGIDVIASPPGKKIKNIQSLSGGERTLTSIALVCAILHTNPPPFVVLDEVEAALDEANTLRFTNILTELSKQSQFVIITHNRATMHAADALFGVSMGGEGVSRLVSVKFAEAQAAVA